MTGQTSWSMMAIIILGTIGLLFVATMIWTCMSAFKDGDRDSIAKLKERVEILKERRSEANARLGEKHDRRRESSDNSVDIERPSRITIDPPRRSSSRRASNERKSRVTKVDVQLQQSLNSYLSE